MRYYCWECRKSVTSELPDDSVIRAVLVCPECIGAGRVIFPEGRHEDKETTDPGKTEEPQAGFRIRGTGNS